MMPSILNFRCRWGSWGRFAECRGQNADGGVYWVGVQAEDQAGVGGEASAGVGEGEIE